MGDDIYQKAHQGLHRKAVGPDCKDLPPLSCGGCPCAYHDNNYFTDPHQGIPTEGYDVLVNGCWRAATCCFPPHRDFVEKHPLTSPTRPCTPAPSMGFRLYYGPWVPLPAL